jgi:hypothetical protein
MGKQCYKVIPMVVCAVLMITVIGVANTRDKAVLNKQVKETMVKVRTGKTLDIRADAAIHLAHLMRKVEPKDVDDKTLADIVSLLDTPDDAVRGEVAGALGFLGPRAVSAVPALLKVLPEADCVRGDLTSAGAIRLALERIGVKPPPPAKCKAAVK